MSGTLTLIDLTVIRMSEEDTDELGSGSSQFGHGK